MAFVLLVVPFYLMTLLPISFRRLVGLLALLPLLAGQARVLLESEGLLLPPGDPDPSRETRDALCYHDWAYYYIKIPHPSWGHVGRIYQRILPVDAGEVTQLELRLHNDYLEGNAHQGQIQLGLHRVDGQWPQPASVSWAIESDTLGNGVFHFDLPGPPFSFQTGEEFLLSMDYLPASPQDTIAIVTGSAGTWTGHSFFLGGNEYQWWGNHEGEAFGDMHFCAEVTWMNGAQAHAWMPAQELDLGLFAPGEQKELRLPILNLGTAPLGTSAPSSSHMRHVASLEGPDSLLNPDTLFLDVLTRAPQSWVGNPQLSARIEMRTNMPMDSLLSLRLHSSLSSSDLLLNDWDEWIGADWSLSFSQFADTGATVANWGFYEGLGRPATFIGHEASQPADSSASILALRELPLQAGEHVSLRWAQLERRRAAGGLHALVWRNPLDSFWYVQAVELDSLPYQGPENTWHTIPWIHWGPAPNSGLHGFGLLYVGRDANEWFVDDLELEFWTEMEAPRLRIDTYGPDILLEWDDIPAAENYRVLRMRDGESREVAMTSGTSYTDERALQQVGFTAYRVVSETMPPAAETCIPSADHPVAGREASRPLEATAPKQPRSLR